jgi:hypothetical protein
LALGLLEGSILIAIELVGARLQLQPSLCRRVIGGEVPLAAPISPLTFNVFVAHCALGSSSWGLQSTLPSATASGRATTVSTALATLRGRIMRFICVAYWRAKCVDTALR